ncbi:hypothetical protein AK972_1331 [Pseudomonas yamanorum]|nr:hypothetical protein AK972_1331 [Pseudomonas yamanorum]
MANIRHCPRHLNCEPSCTGGICCLRARSRPVSLRSLSQASCHFY